MTLQRQVGNCSNSMERRDVIALLLLLLLVMTMMMMAVSINDV